MTTMDRIARFVLDPDLEIPDSALDMATTLLIDTLGVCAGAVNMDAGRIARDFSVDFHAAGGPASEAPLLFDGRKSSLPGAAYAAATQIDNLDAHDGYNPTRGHIGCAVVPALFAFAAQQPDLTGRQALAALAMSYEVAACAGIALHATVADYHTSGAWNALGAAALGARLRGHDVATLRHGLGIAEYHGPRSQMMREIANPTMLHDGSGIGALTGVSAALLAEHGFLGAPAVTVESDDVAEYWANLGKTWTIEQNYIKPYPICRWAHAAIDAAHLLVTKHNLTPGDIAAVQVSTFHQAACLYRGMPETTSQAQYSLAFAVAVLLTHGHIGPDHVTGAALTDTAVARTVKKITVREDARHSDRFPAGRWSDVTMTLENGQVISSGDVHARGGPESPMEKSEIRSKFEAMIEPRFGAARASRIWAAGIALKKSDTLFASLSNQVTEGPL